MPSAAKTARSSAVSAAGRVTLPRAAGRAAAYLPKPKKPVSPARSKAAQRLLAGAGAATPIAFDPQKAAAYAGLAREALLAYLPEGDVDGIRTLTQEYFPDPRYLQALFKDSAGRPQYISGFTHSLVFAGRKQPLNVAQLDYHSMVEKKVPDLAGAKPALTDFLAEAGAKLAAAKAGPLDVVFVEVTDAMARRYQQINPEFRVFAAASVVRAAGRYALLALPLNASAAAALKDNKMAVFSSYVQSWIDTNLQADPAKPKRWEKVPGNRDIVDTMLRTGKWGQPHLP